MMKKLPDAEFEVMKTIWDNEPPVNTRILMEQLGNLKGWKTPALISLLNRLIDRGFLSSEKMGKERQYFPLIGREEYLQFETRQFMKNYHGNSLSSFAAALLEGDGLDKAELQKLIQLVKEGEE